MCAVQEIFKIEERRSKGWVKLEAMLGPNWTIKFDLLSKKHVLVVVRILGLSGHIIKCVFLG